MDGVTVRPGFIIPPSELEFAYSASSGPGGQNVNKTATKARLTWIPARSPSAEMFLSVDERKRLIEKSGGTIRVMSDRFRTREANRKECCRKLADRIVRALRKPKKRVPTKPTRASKKRRLDSKKRVSRLKNLRKRPPED
jgi:ribosome-associated protein